MAEQLVLTMGIEQLDYMRWAARTAEAGLQTRIVELMDRVFRGQKASASNWPIQAVLERYLDSEDKVIAIMAAQSVALRSGVCLNKLSEDTRDTVLSLIKLSEQMHWSKLTN
jgi:hypothetical protein